MDAQNVRRLSWFYAAQVILQIFLQIVAVVNNQFPFDATGQTQGHALGMTTKKEKILDSAIDGWRTTQYDECCAEFHVSTTIPVEIYVPVTGVDSL
jgi:hypothetical protein